MSVAPAHSPPTARPCTILSTTRISGATTPIASNVGIRPMHTDTVPIIMSVMNSIDLRPMRSPKWPNRTPPIGRET